MDEKTLDGLITAYNAAPSIELARIIAFALIDLNDFEASLTYLDSLSGSLDSEQVHRLASAAISADATDRLIDLSSRFDPATSLKLVELLIEHQQNETARHIYLEGRNRDAAFRSTSIETQLGITETRPKLSVVEKTDIAAVTELNRYREKTTDFNDVVGLSHIKKQINKKIILPFQKPSLFQRFRKKIGGGVLLYGPPGCGKTLLARATAGECHASFFNIEISDVLDMYIGESEQKLHAIFEKARGETPSVLFFDELEALAGKREHSRNSSSANVVSQFLAELDGFSQNNHGVLVLASTNVPWAIDSAFLRPGRFDRMFFVPPPDREAREDILKHHMDGRPAKSDIDFKLIASKTSGYSGADLANLVEMAADEAIDESLEKGEEVSISLAHFRDALSESRATTTEWLTTARNYARYANDGGRYNDVLDFINKHGK